VDEKRLALERFRKQLNIQIAVMTFLVASGMFAVYFFAPPPANPAAANPLDQAWNRWGIWLVMVVPLAFGFNLSVMSWLYYWSKRLPPEGCPKASYILALCVTVICAVLGAVYAVNNGLNAFGVAIMCGFVGLMFGGAVGTTFAAPRDAAKGVCAGLVLAALICALDGWLRVQTGKALWNRKAWEARSVCIPFCALLGAIFWMKILRVNRFKRQLAGEQIDRLSK
jgi:hypothetical protein